MEINREIKNITSAFVLEDNLTECVPYGSGHINDTYRLTYGTGKHYILQKMNRSIFTKPVELMENVSGVTAWLKKKIQENGGDVERETLNLVMTKDGLPYYVDEDGEYWRVYLFIENATCYDMVKDENLYSVTLPLPATEYFYGYFVTYSDGSAVVVQDPVNPYKKR
mgnify:CR=1 FL=1